MNRITKAAAAMPVITAGPAMLLNHAVNGIPAGIRRNRPIRKENQSAIRLPIKAITLNMKSTGSASIYRITFMGSVPI